MAAAGALALGLAATPALAERDWMGLEREVPGRDVPGREAGAPSAAPAPQAWRPIDPRAAQRPTFDLAGARWMLLGRPGPLLAAVGTADSESLSRDELFEASGEVLPLTEENFIDPDVDLGAEEEPAVEEAAPAEPQTIETQTIDPQTIDPLASEPVTAEPATAAPADELELDLEEDFEVEDEEDYVAGPAEDDPLEAINRPIFEANLFLDRWMLRPVTRVYIETVPEPGRAGLSNALQNLRTPVILLNDLFQGEMSRAGATFGRFFINSLVGLGGMIDVAGAMGLPGHDEDFGQTLGAHGVGGSPYLVLPFFGPSNPRDAIGTVADVAIDPLTYLTPESLSEIETGVTLVNDRASIINETDTLEATSLDYYAAVRSFYYQNRDFEIANGRTREAAPADPAEPDEPSAGESEEDFEALEEDLDLL